ncbi:LysE family translocator [Sneathiella marina]|uniref:LysE family translocator n=1 Tax=Sneathiella marina TaxID=2950108 RepID=A0ABY4VZP7_9PROT|nr:LysE family translocator [Sneathiella marina]USG60373.1 LysE family translocator [Sneathiella marina]
MEFLPPLLTLALVQVLAVVSPGQSFLVISKLALSAGRAAALSASIGMGLGSIVWATAAMVGLAVALKNDQWLYAALKFCGGGYLGYLAASHWRHAHDTSLGETRETGNVTLSRAFLQGFLTQLANPKVVIFFGSIFFAFIPPHAPTWVSLVCLIIVFFNETLWYSIVAFAFSIRKSQNFYYRAKTWMDRMMALILGAISLKLILDALRIAIGSFEG